MMMTRQWGGGVTLPGIISLELCQGWYLFLEAPTLSRYCPGGRAIQPGIHNLLLYERRLPDQRLHTLMKYLCVCTQTFVCEHKFLFLFIFCVCVYERRFPDPRLHFIEINTNIDILEMLAKTNTAFDPTANFLQNNIVAT